MTEQEHRPGEEDGKPFQQVTPKEGAVHRELDLATARTTLQTIVDTPESTIAESTLLTSIKPEEQARIFAAEHRVVRDIMERHEVLPFDTGKRRVDKVHGPYRLKLTLGLRPDRTRLIMEEGDELVLAFGDSPTGKGDSDGFFDKRPGREEQHSYLELVRHPLVTDEERLSMIRGWIRGRRLFGKALLDWDEPTIPMPEDLDTPPASPKEETGK